jgi:hypothetical protein
MMGYYILDGKEPVEVSDVLTWATQFETADRAVKKTTLSGNVLVSTVFLGLDHQWGDGPPLLFETMVFGGKHAQDQWRYPTWDEATEGHDTVVGKLTWGRLLPLVQWLRHFKAYRSG